MLLQVASVMLSVASDNNDWALYILAPTDPSLSFTP